MLNKDVKVELCSYCKKVPVINPRAFMSPPVCSIDCHVEAFKHNELTGVVQKLCDGAGVKQFASVCEVSIELATQAVWSVYEGMDQDLEMTPERAGFASQSCLAKLEELKAGDDNG